MLRCVYDSVLHGGIWATPTARLLFVGFVIALERDVAAVIDEHLHGARRQLEQRQVGTRDDFRGPRRHAHLRQNPVMAVGVHEEIHAEHREHIEAIFATGMAKAARELEDCVGVDLCAC